MNTSELTKARRKDRAVNDETWIKQFLQTRPFGVLATAIDGQPFVLPNIFYYDEMRHVVYLHSARSGRTVDNVEQNQRVCFNVSELGRMLPADVALEFSLEFSSVVIFGNMTIIKDTEEAELGLQLMLDKYFSHLKPGKDYRSITQQELGRTSVYRLDIEQWSGKQKKVADDFPGAFYYQESQSADK